jgi:hypothetical protein
MKTKTNWVPIVFLVLIVFGRLNAQVNKIAGFYSDNFPGNGFFMTFIQLNTDSTFKYEEGGDLQDDKAIGTYRLVKDTLFLIYKPSKYDTLYYTKDDPYLNTGGYDSTEFKLISVNNKKYRLVYDVGKRPVRFFLNIKSYFIY